MKLEFRHFKLKESSHQYKYLIKYAQENTFIIVGEDYIDGYGAIYKTHSIDKEGISLIADFKIDEAAYSILKSDLEEIPGIISEINIPRNRLTLEAIENIQRLNSLEPTIYYAGIGSRETPPEYLKLFRELGMYFAKKGFILRSGHADGADTAFELGCSHVDGQSEIYIPWEGFNGSNSYLFKTSRSAIEIAKSHHPAWDNLSDSAKEFMGRNTYQVLGKDLVTPSTFIICWTKNGKGAGGTGQAIRIAKSRNITVFDAGAYENTESFKGALKEYLKKELRI